MSRPVTQGAEQSLLLDYVSPINPTVAVKAVREKAWPVFLGVAGWSLLKLGVSSTPSYHVLVNAYTNKYPRLSSLLEYFLSSLSKSENLTTH
jgi:hypothetical protein